MQNDSTKNPTPAPGQIWRSNISGRDYIIASASEHAVRWTMGGWDPTHALGSDYECIGVETPAGRVMVGERRTLGTRTYTLDRVAPSGKFILRSAEGVEQFGEWPANVVATWPIVRGGEWDRVSIGGVEVPAASVTWAWVPGTASEEAIGEIRAVMDKWRNGGAAILPLGVSFAHLPPMSQEQIDALADRLGLKMADPRAEREQRRREIDAVLREDARRFPAFATARRAALLYEIETGTGYGKNHDAATTRTHIWCFHEYERLRGGLTKPSAEATAYAHEEIADGAVSAYERARGLP